jgi:anaerobic magnesium-protoporphyrin IX monomethyl ester cyclase
MVDVTLVYPYINSGHNNSIFRFPPLGLGYLASYLIEHGFSANIVDATFIGEEAAIQRVKESHPRIIGVYSMFTMREAAYRFAEALSGSCELVVAGGPMPTVEPDPYLIHFDVVAVGEGEKTLMDLASGKKLSDIPGIVFRERDGRPLRSGDKGGETVRTAARAPIEDLDSISLPSRDLFDNEGYLRYYRKRRRPTVTSIITSRGCPFSCDFCSHPIFGSSFRERSPGNIADEVEQVLGLGYERVFFQDDCFTLTKNRVIRFCDEVEKRGLSFSWECLSRVDNMDRETARRMRGAGCDQVFFGLESGSERVLKIMNKSATPDQGRRAVEAAHLAGLKTGAFFIFGYPGDDDESMLETIRFASHLPLDYVGFTFPYPIPGTPLHERIKCKMMEGDPEPKQKGLIQHQLIYNSDFSEAKLKFGIAKATAQLYLRRRLGPVAPLLAPLEAATDGVFRMLK